jgi:hypothetical protein
MACETDRDCWASSLGWMVVAMLALIGYRARKRDDNETRHAHDQTMAYDPSTAYDQTTASARDAAESSDRTPHTSFQFLLLVHYGHRPQVRSRHDYPAKSHLPQATLRDTTDTPFSRLGPASTAPPDTLAQSDAGIRGCL